MARTRNAPTLAELTLMGFLADGPAHPYSINTKLCDQGGPTELAFSSIYAALAKLAKLGLVTSKAESGERGKARRVYRLTPQGRDVLKSAARDSLAHPLIGGHANDVGIAGLALVSREDALVAIAEARSALKERKPPTPEDGLHLPAKAVALHRSMLHATEDKFYAQLERMVQAANPAGERRRSAGQIARSTT